MKISIEKSYIDFEHGGDTLSVTLHRTLRLPEDGRAHNLPPSLGAFPCKRVEDYRERVAMPAAWRDHGGIFVPLWQREALWIGFRASRRPFAVKVAAGKVNAVSGETWQTPLAPARNDIGNPRQDYLVSPPQPWLDGFNAGGGKIRQFVAMALGGGHTVEAQVTGKEDVGGLQLLVVPPKDGLLMPKPSPLRSSGVLIGSTTPRGMSKKGLLGGDGPQYSCSVGGASFSYSDAVPSDVQTNSLGAEMGFGQGGEMVQKLYPDPHGIDTWDEKHGGRLFVHVINSALYQAIVGEAPPPTPLTQQTYQGLGYPWTTLWDGEMSTLPPSQTLSKAKTVGQVDHEKGVKEGREW